MAEAVERRLDQIDPRASRPPALGATLAAAPSAVGSGLFPLRELRDLRWVEVIGGLGLLALVTAAAVSFADPGSGSPTLSLVLLAVVGGLICIHGTRAEIEASRNQAAHDLLALRERHQAEFEHTEGLLHDLRSGLLSIEGAMAGVGSDLAEPLRLEAARLRQLISTGPRGRSNNHPPVPFDLVPAVRSLVALKRARGAVIDLRLPATAPVRGSEADIMTVVENLLANAERHGLAPTVVAITEAPGEIRLAVSDAGPGIHPGQADRIFERGVTSHPDGTGLGLYRARLLTERNAGELVLDISPEGRPTSCSASNHGPPPVGPPLTPRRRRQRCLSGSVQRGGRCEAERHD